MTSSYDLCRRWIKWVKHQQNWNSHWRFDHVSLVRKTNQQTEQLEAVVVVANDVVTVRSRTQNNLEISFTLVSFYKRLKNNLWLCDFARVRKSARKKNYACLLFIFAMRAGANGRKHTAIAERITSNQTSVATWDDWNKRISVCWTMWECTQRAYD